MIAEMMSYDVDLVAWSEQQAALLRQLAEGERVGALLDWPNLIEEIEATGRSELRACEGMMEQAVLHLLKLAADPANPAASVWRSELLSFLRRARRTCTPAMRRRVDWRDVLDGARERMAPGARSFRLGHLWPGDLLAAHPDIDALLAKVLQD